MNIQCYRLKKFFGLILLILHLPLNGQENSYVDQLLQSIPSSKKGITEAALSILPAEQKTGISNYLNMIGVKVHGAQNVGLTQYHQNLLKENPCFDELAGQFYSSIHNDVFYDSLDFIQIRFKSGTMNNSVNSPINGNLMDLGKKPGWLWDKAMKFAQGDSLLAIQLIGICGHDDTMQLPDNSKMASRYVSNQWQNQINQKVNSPELKYKMHQLAQNLLFTKTKYPNLGNDVLMTALKDRYDFKNGIPCPDPGSAFYFPKTLSQDADISEELKSKIIRLQSPTMGAKAIKSKSYHILGAALTTCQLVQRGVPDFIAIKMIKGAVNAYRSGRLCQILKNSSPYFGPREPKELQNTILQQRKNMQQCFREEVKKDTTGTTYSTFSVIPVFDKANYKKDCAIASLLPYQVWIDSDITDEILLNKIVRKVAELDTQDLFLKSKNYKDAKNCEGPQLSDSVYEYMNEYGKEGSENPCPQQWSSERCSSVRTVMATYSVDFEWSEAQQLAGYQFAKKNCRRYDSEKSIEVMSCKALGKNPSNPSVKSTASSPATQ